MKTQTQKVSMAEKIGYSLGDGSANLIFQMMMMFQPCLELFVSRRETLCFPV